MRFTQNGQFDFLSVIMAMAANAARPLLVTFGEIKTRQDREQEHEPEF
jgi:hypothetical protein